MANLSLKHNGNMDITSASIGSGGTLNVQYGQNTTGNITGWTHNQSDPLVCGETYTITLLPQFSGTVLSENFVVSGVDEAGVPRSDTSVLRQGFDSNLLHYNPNPRNNPSRMVINSSSATETYLEVNATVVGHSSSSNTVGFYIWHYLPGDPQSKSNFVRFNVVDPVGPDTGTSITAITIVVDDFVTDNGWAGVEYAPEDASTSFVYSSSDTSKATIDPNTGEITILESGYVTFCVRDTVSGLEDCKQIYGIKTHPDTGVTAITAISISVAETIIEQGYAYAFYSPNDVEVNLAFSSSDPTIASIDPDTGEITVYQDGYVTFCVTDSISGLQDCKGSYVKKAVYITSISIVVDDVIRFEGQASAAYTPANGTVSLIYTSSNPEIATIDPITGEINVIDDGYVTFCVRDTYTNISDCKTVQVYGIASEPLTFLITRSGNIRWVGDATYGNIYGNHTIQYSKNGGAWTSITSNYGNAAPIIYVSAGDVVKFKGTNPTYYYGNEEQGWNGQGIHSGFGLPLVDHSQAGQVKSTCSFIARGNVLSLIYGDDFLGKKSISSKYNFWGMFNGCDITDASQLIIPVTSATESCCYGMFSDCVNLVSPPQLPATSLAESCYYGMFDGCSSLTTAPTLPAEILRISCYAYMFHRCSSLMYVKCLARYIGAYDCTYLWLSGVGRGGTFAKNPAMSSWTIGTDNGIPGSWTIVDAT